MAPVSGVRVPASTFISVDLPAPLWPTSPRHSPAPTPKSTPAKARTAPKLFATPFRLTICSGSVPIGPRYACSVLLLPKHRPLLLRAGYHFLGVLEAVLGVGDAALLGGFQALFQVVLVD